MASKPKSKTKPMKTTQEEIQVLRHIDTNDPEIRQKYYYVDFGVKVTYEHTCTSHSGYCSEPDYGDKHTETETVSVYYNVPLTVMKCDISRGSIVTKEILTKFYSKDGNRGSYCRICDSSYKIVSNKLVPVAKISKEIYERDKLIPITLEDVL